MSCIGTVTISFRIKGDLIILTKGNVKDFWDCVKTEKNKWNLPHVVEIPNFSFGKRIHTIRRRNKKSIHFFWNICSYLGLVHSSWEELYIKPDYFKAESEIDCYTEEYDDSDLEGSSVERDNELYEYYNLIQQDGFYY